MQFLGELVGGIMVAVADHYLIKWLGFKDDKN